MAVRIRLSRGGSKKRPFYRVVVADSRSPRDGRFIERLGSYNPLLPHDHQDRLVLDLEKAKSWLAKGAEPTDRLQKLFANLGLCEAPKFSQTKKPLPKAKAQERVREKEEKIKAAEEAKIKAAEDAKAQAEAEKQAAAEAKAQAEAAPAVEEAPAADEAPAE